MRDEAELGLYPLAIEGDSWKDFMSQYEGQVVRNKNEDSGTS